jgi:hypothetical protein
MPLDHVLDDATQTLSRVLGAERGAEAVAKAKNASGIATVESPTDLLLFAEALIKEGGFTEVVGRALKVQALLRGARISVNGAIETLDRRSSR